jgi:hypothetical protein
MKLVFAWEIKAFLYRFVRKICRDCPDLFGDNCNSRCCAVKNNCLVCPVPTKKDPGNFMIHSRVKK